MSDDSATAPKQSAPGRPAGIGQQPIFARLGRLVLKELREIFRDRRTIITLVVMPALIYPLLALVFQRFLLTSLSSSQEVIFVLGVESPLDQNKLFQQIQAGQFIIGDREKKAEKDAAKGELDVGRGVAKLIAGAAVEDAEPSELHWLYLKADEMERNVADGAVNLGVIARQRGGVTSEHGLASPLEWELVYRPGSPPSENALHYVESRLAALNEAQLDKQLRQLQVTAVVPGAVTRRATRSSGAPVYSLAALIPLILVLTTVTGAVYPAIDLTAGERERGTLEMLIAAPVPRLGLLLGKYVAVLAVALVTAVVNLTGMTITAKSTGLAGMLFPQQEMSLVVVLKVWLLLCLLAAFFSAVLLAVTSYARSFKEAQAYIIPLMLISLVPGIVCLLPSLEFSGALAVTPLMNIVMLARDVLEGDVAPALAAATVLSTAIYVVAALAVAARIFGTDAVLYGSPATWSDIFRRPAALQESASPSAAMFALAVMFPSYFVLAGSLAQTGQTQSISRRLVTSSLMTALVFVAIPLAVAIYQRVRLSAGLGLRTKSVSTMLLTLPAAVVLGLSLWPFAHEIFLLNRPLGVTNFERGELDLARQLVAQLRDVPPALVLFTLGVMPGICEELFFRGFLFGALRRVMTGWGSICVAALVFGLFHVVGGNVFAPERFLPSAFMGLALGWVRMQTGSVIPCMLVHAVHNSGLLSLLYWQNGLWGGEGAADDMHLPASWLAAAAAGTAASAGVIYLISRLGRGERQAG